MLSSSNKKSSASGRLDNLDINNLGDDVGGQPGNGGVQAPSVMI